jgi:hypothetical protein
MSQSEDTQGRADGSKDDDEIRERKSGQKSDSGSKNDDPAPRDHTSKEAKWYYLRTPKEIYFKSV